MVVKKKLRKVDKSKKSLKFFNQRWYKILTEVVKTVAPVIAIIYAAISYTTTKEQLDKSIESFNEQRYAGRPKITLENCEIKNLKEFLSGDSTFFAISHFLNNGNRHGRNFYSRAFLVSDNFSVKSADMDEEYAEKIEPGISRYSGHKYLGELSREDFYYCIDVIYEDHLINKKFSNAYYYHFYNGVDGYKLYLCSIDQREKLTKTVNLLLNYKGKRMFGKAL